jgi:hypothetical protein
MSNGLKGAAMSLVLEYESSCELEELETHLQAVLSGRVRDLRITSHDNGLVIQGQTRTYYAKQVAQQEVMKASSMPVRANEIEVV